MIGDLLFRLVFAGEHVADRLPLAEAQPVVPRLAKIVLHRNVLHVQVVLFRNLLEDSAHGKVFGFQYRVGCPDGAMVMSIAGGSHR